MKKRTLIRIGAQLVLSGIFFFGLIGSSEELKLLFVTMMFVNIVAILLSTFITLSSGKERIAHSILFNLGAAAIFFFVGFYLEDLLTHEVIERVEPDANDPDAMVVKARLVSFGGIQFLLLSLIHAMFSYVDFLDIKLSNESPGSTEFSGTLFTVKIGKKLHLIPFSEIEFIEASGNYVHIYREEKQYPARLTLQEFFENAQSDQLVRVHRSFIVNITQVRELEGVGDGYLAVLKNGRKVKVGKQYKQALFEKLGIES